jgi:hypothetical protein
MRRARTALLATLAALALPVGVRAQWQASIDAGVAHLRQTGIAESVAQTVGATVDGLSTRAWFHAAGLSSLQPNNAWTGQAIALGGFSGEIVHPARWEVGAAVSGFSETGAPTTTSGELNARVRFAAAMGGIALGGGTGLTARSGDDVTLGRGTVEGWWSIGNERLLAGATRTRAGPSSYTDLGIGWRHEAKGASLEASTGIRSATGNGGWQSAFAELWMAPRIALALGAGNALPDVVRGTPSTRYLSAALRIAWQPHPTLWPNRASNGGLRVAVSRLSAGTARIEVTAPSAARVEVMADFTNWEPVVLERTDGGWFVERAVSPGLHRLAIRIDGGAWVAPANVPSLHDDLGGEVGLISVP